MPKSRLLLLCVTWILLWRLPCDAAAPSDYKFFATHCNDCHAGGSSEGGLALDELSTDLSHPATLAKWVRIYDRVDSGEMPPEDVEAPSADERESFRSLIQPRLSDAHAKVKGTVLRRLNRREYENTLNDLFGTELDLGDMLPDDSKTGEFDNVGASLGVSMVHLQRYMDAMKRVLDASIAITPERPESKTVTASYLGSREGDRFIGSKWKELPDGAVVRFSGGGYPTGMMRGTGVNEPGRYRVRVRGYAHQSDQPVTFSVGGTSFAPGSEKPIYGYWSFTPDDVQTIEFEAHIDRRYMIAIEPYGINDPDRYKRLTIKNYDGPGLAILDVTVEGPLVDQWPSRGHELLFADLKRSATGKQQWVQENGRKVRREVFEIQSKNESHDITRTLRRVAESAFRRPVSDDEVGGFVKLFQKEQDQGSTIEDALRTSVTAIFCSPGFLYFDETPGPLNDHALASRISYFLTRTSPDEELMSLARRGKLTNDREIGRQVDRLIDSPRFERFIVDFTDSWLDLSEMDFTIPDRKLFPEYDEYLRYSMPLETRRYVHELVRSNLSVSHLVKSEFAMLNSRLASHYGLPALRGSHLRKVALPSDSPRGGLLTQASILKVTANGTNTSPVTRGAWVLERILGRASPPPPPGIPGVEPDIRGASTLRELLAKHRELDSCQSCHDKIDPPGFALESFNPIGGYRERYRSVGEGDRVDKRISGRKVNYRLGPNVDSSGTSPDGYSFENYIDFRNHLAADQELLARAFAEKLATFASGRELGFSDRPIIDAIVEQSKRDGYGIRDLIHTVVLSDLVRNK